MNFIRRLFLKLFRRKNKEHITDVSENLEFSKTREINITPGREMEKPAVVPQAEERLADHCPYCNSKDFVKRGTRKKKFEVVQLYLCRICGKTFTAQLVKGKRYPLHAIIEALNYYHIGYPFESSCKIIKQKFGFDVKASTLSGWVEEFSEFCSYGRMRPYAIKHFAPKDTIEVVTMAHRQLYQFRYHRAKMKLSLDEEYRNRSLRPLKEYLDSVSSETPHQYFEDGVRASEIKERFSTDKLYIRGKQNYATKTAAFVLQAVKENTARHDALQRFFIANDSVTVATEVPVYITGDDIVHMRDRLGFDIPECKEIGSRHRLIITGHIDFLQVRNGRVHILDFKPRADREKPIEQLTWYALALSRLTGLRMYEFMCAWFDEDNYYEFFPLHAVYKKTQKKRKQWNKSLKVGEVFMPDEMRPKHKIVAQIKV